MPDEEYLADKLNDVENRLRTVEAAVIELGLMAKYAKYGVMILALTLGYDVSGLVI